jgi:hypothetical protein
VFNYENSNNDFNFEKNYIENNNNGVNNIKSFKDTEESSFI